MLRDEFRLGDFFPNCFGTEFPLGESKSDSFGEEFWLGGFMHDSFLDAIALRRREFAVKTASCRVARKVCMEVKLSGSRAVTSSGYRIRGSGLRRS